MKRVLLILIFFPILSFSQVKVLSDIDFSTNEYKLVFTYERAYDTINLISHTFKDFVISDKKQLIELQQSEIHVKSEIFSEEAPTYVFTYTENKHVPKWVNQLIINQNQAFWPQVMDYLYQCNIQSLVVEGGAFTLQSLINEGLWDEARVFTAPKTLQKGVLAPILKDNKMIFEEKIIYDQYTQYLHLKHEANYF